MVNFCWIWAFFFVNMNREPEEWKGDREYSFLIKLHPPQTQSLPGKEEIMEIEMVHKNQMFKDLFYCGVHV